MHIKNHYTDNNNNNNNKITTKDIWGRSNTKKYRQELETDRLQHKISKTNCSKAL